MLLFLDTETTGVKSKPWLVQLAAILTENDGTLRGSCNLIIRPDNWTIPSEAAAIHGITTEIAEACGVPLSIAIAVFNNLALRVTGTGRVIAHNKKFDLQIMDYCYERGGWPSRIEGLSSYCTMEAMTPYCKIPPTPAMVKHGFKNFKSPRLSEAFKFAFNRELQNAHDALYDVHACKDLYFWMMAKESEKLVSARDLTIPGAPQEDSNPQPQNEDCPVDHETLNPKPVQGTFL